MFFNEIPNVRNIFDVHQIVTDYNKWLGQTPNVCQITNESLVERSRGVDLKNLETV
jgi:hypothetical protein